MDVLVLQHIACEPPGAFEDVLAAAGADIHRVELDEGDALPPWQDFVAIVAMGGPMSVNDDAELPWLTAEGQSDPVFAGLPAEFLTLQWHGDTFDVPEGGVLLASSPVFPNQGFRVGRTAYGVQFHVEVTEQMAREWAEVPAYAEYADRVLGAGGIDRLMADFDAARERMLDVGRRMFERWVEIAVAVPR